jgi:hypothetical protein
VAVRLAWTNLRATPGREAFTAGALAVGIALMGGVRAEPALVTVGVAVVVVTALGAARIPDPVRLRTAAMLSLVGASRSVRRRIVVVDVGVSALLAVGPGVLLSTVVSRIADDRGNAWPATPAAVGAAVVVAALVGGGGEETVFRPLQGVGRARLTVLVRLAFAGPLVALGILAPGTARSWFDLDLTLIPGLVLVAIGLSLVAPMLLLAVGRLLARVGRRAGTHLAGSLVIDRRRALAPAACLVAAGTVVVVAQAVLGTGLAEREADRRATFDLRAGTGAEQVTVEVGGRTGQGLFGLPAPDPDSEPYSLSDEDVAAIAAAAPEGIVAPYAVPFTRASPQAAYISVPKVVPDEPFDEDRNHVVLATPELLRALRLEAFEPDLAAGRALVLDPSVMSGDESVALWTSGVIVDPNDNGVQVKSVPARLVDGFGNATRLPAVIAPAPVLQETFGLGPDRILRGAVVTLPHPASGAEVDAIASAVPPSLSSTVLRGDTVDVDVREEGRLDASGSVFIRSSAEALGGVLLVGGLGLAALLVGLRFAALANRAEDDLFEVVGAPPSTLRRIAAWQGALVTVVGVVLGFAVGLAGTASGIARYNSSGRGDLPPIPFGVPTPLLVGLVVLPLTGAAVAWASAGRRPAVDPVLLAERIGW